MEMKEKQLVTFRVYLLVMMHSSLDLYTNSRAYSCIASQPRDKTVANLLQTVYTYVFLVIARY